MVTKCLNKYGYGRIRNYLASLIRNRNKGLWIHGSGSAKKYWRTHNTGFPVHKYLLYLALHLYSCLLPLCVCFLDFFVFFFFFFESLAKSKIGFIFSSLFRRQRFHETVNDPAKIQKFEQNVYFRKTVFQIYFNFFSSETQKNSKYLYPPICLYC
jgi:hypothetical protein